MKSDEKHHRCEEDVPLFRRWGDWYALVIAVLVLLIGFFYYFTKKFS